MRGTAFDDSAGIAHLLSPRSSNDCSPTASADLKRQKGKNRNRANRWPYAAGEPPPAFPSAVEGPIRQPPRCPAETRWRLPIDCCVASRFCPDPHKWSGGARFSIRPGRAPPPITRFGSFSVPVPRVPSSRVRRPPGVTLDSPTKCAVRDLSLCPEDFPMFGSVGAL
jgi:hypothetical protein